MAKKIRDVVEEKVREIVKKHMSEIESDLNKYYSDLMSRVESIKKFSG